MLNKIQNEIKSGNPVVWRWRFADQLRRRRQAEKEQPTGAAPAGGGGLFGLPEINLQLPGPPKSI